LLSYYIIVPLGVLSVMGVGAGISDPGELPELLTGLGIIALTIVLLVAAFFAFAPAAYILDAQGIGSPGVWSARYACLTRR
jgi:hypothetical protein